MGLLFIPFWQGNDPHLWILFPPLLLTGAWCSYMCGKAMRSSEKSMQWYMGYILNEEVPLSRRVTQPLPVLTMETQPTLPIVTLSHGPSWSRETTLPTMRKVG
jgi:hypothetical protein